MNTNNLIFALKIGGTVLSLSLLCFSLVSLSACGRGADRANEYSEKVIRAYRETQEAVARKYQETSISDFVPESVSQAPSKVAETVSTHTSDLVQETAAQTARQIKEDVVAPVERQVDEVREVASDVKQTTSKWSHAARNTAVYYVRRLPRSEREANQMVVENGRSWMDSFKQWLRAATDNGHARILQSRRANYGVTSGANGGGSSVKGNQNRLKGREGRDRG